MSASNLIRKPTLGEWELCEKLGHRREYVLYRAQHCSSQKKAYLRVLSANLGGEARECFVCELSLASEHLEHFLPVRLVRSCGEGLVAVSDIPKGSLATTKVALSERELPGLCLNLAEALELIHEAGRIHGCLVPEAVEVVATGTSDVQLRLLDIGHGFRIGRSCAVQASAVQANPSLPPEVREDRVARTTWDVYGFGRLGLQLMERATPSSASEPASEALAALLRDCSSAKEARRPPSMEAVSRRLRDIAKQMPTSRAAAPGKRPAVKAPSRLESVESAWFVEDGLTRGMAAEIDGFEPFGMSQSGRVLTSLLTIAAATALAITLAVSFGVIRVGI